MREKIAELAHSQWSGWMEYLFSKCKENASGEVVIPAWATKRWRRQMTTKYSELSEPEKDSDRAEADKFIAAFSELEHENAELKEELRETANSCSETNLEIEWCSSCTSIRWCAKGQELLAKKAERDGN